ncbi:MAG: SGNH/GDSL hydrolase family protein [Anaerolineae bacterium]|nr:SGNH/GDSL hydrolase family protein [Anaerolineae bacterium]
MKQLLQNIGARLLGLLLGLMIVEIGLHLLPENALKALTTHNQNRHELYQTDPAIGWQHKPNAATRYVIEGEIDVPVKINSRGLYDTEHPYQKPAGTFRILLLGDSVTESLVTPLDKGFPYLLEGCLNNHYRQPIEVINGGVSYYASTEELFFLQQEGLRYRPDLVLVGFSLDDLDAYAARQSSDGWLNSMGGYLIELDESGQLQKTWVEWKNPGPYEDISALEGFLRRRSRTYYILAHPDTQFNHWTASRLESWQEKWQARWPFALIWGPPPEEQEPQDDFRKNLDLMVFAPDFPYGPEIPAQLVEGWAIIGQTLSQIQAVSASADAGVGVLILPQRKQAMERYYLETYQKYADRYGVDIAGIAWNYAAPNQALSQLLAEKNIPSLDLLPIYRHYDAAHSAPIYFERDNHINERGHQVTAEAICQWVVENGFISEPQQAKD